LCAQAGNLHIAWSDQQQQLHTMTSSDRGDHWGHKKTLNETSGHGPATCEFNGDFYIAWTGTGAGAHLNVKASRGEKVELEDASAFGPALTVFSNRLFLAWVGVDPQHSLNIMSSANGTVFEDKVTLSQSSIGSPALQAAQAGTSPSGGPGEPLLLLAWTNRQGRLQVGGSSDGQIFQFGGPIEEETSFTGPALLTEQLDHSRASTVYISWTGTGTRHTINTMASVNPEKFSDGFRPSTKHTLSGSRSLAGPSLTGLFSGSESTFFMGYAREDDHHLEVITWPKP
jgi:hypothetical protein